MNKAFKSAFAGLAIMLFTFGIWSAATAYEVSPMRVFLVPANGYDSTTLSINNVRREPLPIEINVQKRLIAEDGTQSFEPAEGDFIVFPAQFEVAAGDSQAVRIQYVGAPPTDVAVSYVIQFAEVPVTPPGFSGVKFAYNFGVAVYVEPANATEKLDVEAQASNGKIRLTIDNIGSKYSLLSSQYLRIKSGDFQTELSPEQLVEKIPNPLLAPTAQRVVEFELEGIPDGPVENIRFREFGG